MIILNGKTLGERHQQLNDKVNHAVKGKIDFNVAKELDEKSDVDKLFKIDLAAKYKNIEYIMEIFRCADRLYISRALDKCSWLYDDDLKHIVNEDYLSNNVFPSMSIKMKNKVLTAIATNLKNDDTRAVEFCAYCMKRKIYNIALKFLIHTPKSFKLDVIVKKTKMYELVTQTEGEHYLEQFIGDSFDLAENYVNNFDFPGQKSNAIYKLRYMYSLSNEKYLEMLETCDNSVYVLGRRLSKHIIQNHKSRVMKKPLLYANALNTDIIKRNCKIEEAKIIAVALLPDRSTRFYRSNYYTKNKFVLGLIPAEEQFTFIKKIFNEKYKDKPFEDSYKFYSNNLFEMMTIHERESWALRNIASQNEILGNGNDYLWYRFLNFEKAFKELRKEIKKTTDLTKRCEMLKVMLDSANNDQELTKLLDYFFERHRNEDRYVTDRFLSKLIKDHKVWLFSDSCWKALEKIFYNIDVFDQTKYQNYSGDYIVLTLMYYVLNELSVPEVLHEYLEMNVINFYTLKKYLNNLKSETETIFQYILQYYTARIEAMSSTLCEEDSKKKIKLYLRCTLEIAQYCDKTKDDLPEIVLTHIKLDWPEFKNHKLFAGKNLSSTDIMHYLKKDATLVVTQFPQIKSYCESNRGNVNWLIHKLKVYFSHDISEKYLNFYNEYLSAESLHYITVQTAVRGILILADSTSKIDFLDKYTPTARTMNKAEISKNTLDIQIAICKQMMCSRPPLPLAKVFQYVTGDYVQHCLVLFSSFLVNLPQPQCLELVQKMINSPISIQKHGLRLAFECVETEKLQMIILDSWSKTKNVSLRMILYKLLIMKILNESGETQLTLFDPLITFTLDLNEDDEETLKLMGTIKLPDHLVGRYLEAAWNTVSKFSDKPNNFEHMAKIIYCIETKLERVPKICIDKIVNDHIHFMLDEEQIINDKYKQGYDNLIKSKWQLTISNLTYMINEKQLEVNLVLVKHITNKCIEMWNKLDKSGSRYVIRHFLKEFIKDLDIKSYDYDESSFSNYITLLQVIEEDLKKVLPEKEIYQVIWKLRASVVTKKVILNSKLHKRTLILDDIINPGIELGYDFGMLIKTNVDKGTFYRMFCEQIQGIVTATVDNFHGYFESSLFSSTDVLILFCLGLLRHEIFETYMIALNILPTEYEGKFLDAYLSAINKIQAFQNTELQFYLYEKFVNTDFKKRNYINHKKYQ